MKKPLRIVALMLVLMMFGTVISGCAAKTGSTSSGSKNSSADQKKLKLAIVYSIVVPFFDQVTKGAEDEIKNGNKNVDLIVKAPDKGDVGLQIGIVENLISMGVDGIAIGPSDSDALTPLINEAIAKGIKVVCFDTDAPKSNRMGYIGTDNVKAGQLLGEEVAKINDKAKVICTIAVPTQLGLQQRLQGAKDVWAEKYPGVQLVDVESGGGDPAKTLSNIEDMVKTHPDFNVLIGIDAQAGPAAVTAWKSMGITGKSVVTFDDLPEVIQGIRDGQINVAITQHEYDWGKDIIDILSDSIRNGTKIPANTVIQPVVINKDNVDQFYK